jgi:opacity protein-like surface antigen
MKKRRLLACILAVILASTLAFCQQSVVPAGGNATGTGGSTAFTVGQVAYSVVTGTDGFVIQGVQQPYEISTVTGIEVEDVTLDYAVYPNPTAGMLRLVISAPDPESYRYQIFDLNGKLVGNNKVTGNETEISMDHLFASVYFLKVIRGNSEVKVFKIVKK